MAIIYDWTVPADVIALRNLIDEIRWKNKVFTVNFMKKSGEPRQINAVARHKVENVPGKRKSVLYSGKSKLNLHNVLQVWELQITNVEKDIVLYGNYDPKPEERKFRSMCIENITEIYWAGKVYIIKNNPFRF
jgi:hypothetical protein